MKSLLFSFIIMPSSGSLSIFNPSWRDPSLNVSRGDPGIKKLRPHMKTRNLSVIYFNRL